MSVLKEEEPSTWRTGKKKEEGRFSPSPTFALSSSPYFVKFDWIVSCMMMDLDKQTETVLRTENINIFYGAFHAVKNVSMEIPKNRITALIGPSGCGKSTILRCFNRLNDLVSGFRLEGRIDSHGQNLYAPDIDAVAVRRKIGMVFQKPNPFPKSIYDNIAYGARVNNYKGDMDELVENRSAKLICGMR